MVLQTMRAKIDLDTLPKGLASALGVYDALRQAAIDRKVDLNNLRPTEFELDRNLFRLERGLSQISILSAIRLGRRYADIDPHYVKTHGGDLLTLPGLFYWNGSDEFTRRMLLLAWKRGASLLPAKC